MNRCTGLCTTAPAGRRCRKFAGQDAVLCRLHRDQQRTENDWIDIRKLCSLPIPTAQCLGLTKTGNRCRKLAADGKIYCRQQHDPTVQLALTGFYPVEELCLRELAALQKAAGGNAGVSASAEPSQASVSSVDIYR